MIHVISREEEQILLNLFPDLRAKIVFIPNGIVDPLSSPEEKPNIEFSSRLQEIKKENRFVFLFLSRINRKKA